MKSNITISKATVLEAECLAEMRTKFLLEISEKDHQVEVPQLKMELSKYFKETLQNETVIAWIAKDKEAIVASSTMVIWKPPNSFSGIGKNGRGYILNMYTHKPYRKKGIGATLLKKLIDTAIEMNLEKVHLHTTDNGRSLYESFGLKSPYYPELVLKIDDYEN